MLITLVCWFEKFPLGKLRDLNIIGINTVVTHLHRHSGQIRHKDATMNLKMNNNLLSVKSPNHMSAKAHSLPGHCSKGILC